MHARLFVMQDESLRKAFGVWLKNLCKQKNWSQEEPATKVDVRFLKIIDAMVGNLISSGERSGTTP
jgi:hypothetical protein